MVLEQVATLDEIAGLAATYSLADVHKANALLDMRADIQKAAQQERDKQR